MPAIHLHTRRPVAYEPPEPERGGNVVASAILVAIGFVMGAALAAVLL